MTEKFIMRKYIDAEKLIAEIERLKEETNIGICEYDKGEENGRFEVLNHLLSTITSLQQEQPDNEDIDKVAQELYEHLYELKRRNNVPTNLYEKKEIINLWKAGVEYGRNHPKQGHFADASKMGPEVDLEKAAEQYSQNILAGGEDMFDAITDGFIAGAKWLEEQMKKNTVDGHCFVSPVDPSVLFVQTDFFENKKNLKHGQTCKVIVLKSHEK